MLSLLWLSTIPPCSELFTALMLGILEGITEFLPVSSTGHLLIAEHWLGSRSDFFNIVIQAGAILAITFVFRKKCGHLPPAWTSTATVIM